MAPRVTKGTKSGLKPARALPKKGPRCGFRCWRERELELVQRRLKPPLQAEACSTGQAEGCPTFHARLCAAGG
jgi:hypothetical protein